MLIIELKTMLYAYQYNQGLVVPWELEDKDSIVHFDMYKRKGDFQLDTDSGLEDKILLQMFPWLVLPFRFLVGVMVNRLGLKNETIVKDIIRIMINT